PVVLGIFMVAVYRLGRTAVTTLSQGVLALTAAAAAALSPMGIVPILALAGGGGMLLFHTRRVGALVRTLLPALLAGMPLLPWSALSLVTPLAQATASAQPTGLIDLGLFFFKVGAFIFGGGLTMIPFIQEQVVNQLHWLTQQEFIDGLALGQFTPGPVLMVAAYVGYKVVGLVGA